MTLLDSVKNTFVPIHREGYPFIAAFAAATLFLGYFSSILFWIGLILTAWCVYFYRDPERVTPVDDRLVVSPADGVISAVGPAVPPSECRHTWCPSVTRNASTSSGIINATTSPSCS